MLIAGTGGFAKQLLFTLEKLGLTSNAVFFDDTSEHINPVFSSNFRVIRRLAEVSEYFQTTDKRFVLAVGGPKNRKSVCEKLERAGGIPFSVIDHTAEVSPFAVEIREGTTALSGALIETGVRIGKGALLNVRCIITHDTTIGNYSEIAPNATLLGGVTIGNECLIGASATILPRVKIGNYVIVGAGAVVIGDVPDFETVAGIPAKMISRP